MNRLKIFQSSPLPKSEIVNSPRPPFVNVPLAVGLEWQGGSDFIFQEKMDGVWHVADVGGSILCTEKMRSGELFTFDLLSHTGQDLRPLPLRERLRALNDVWGTLTAQNSALRAVSTGQGGAFLRAILERGGEGIVAKPLDAPYGATWHKCKRVETLDLIVSEKHAGGKSSIRLQTAQGEDCGWCPARAAFDRVRVGDWVEIAAFGKTAKGLLREPRFVRVRPDKEGKTV